MTDDAPRAPRAPLDPGAFRALFEAHVAYVWGALRFFGVRQADQEDLAHEVFLTVHRLWPQVDPSRPLRPWLFSIAYHAALGYRRRAHQQREVLTEAPEQPDGSPGADDKVAHKQELALVERALADVDEERRAVLLLVDMDGCSAPEAAEALSIPLNTVYSRLRRGREDFAQALSRLRKKRGERDL